MTVLNFLNSLNSTNTNFKIQIKPGIDSAEIIKIQKRLDVKLPDDLIDFYSFTNGMAGDDWIFNIIPLNEVDKLKDKTGEYFVFAEYMIYSETCGLEINQYDNNKYNFFTWTTDSNNPELFKRKYITDSLNNFIKLYCDKGTFGIFGEE